MNRQILPKTVGYCYCKILQYLTICRLANLPACFSFETMPQYQTFLNRNIIAGWLATTVYFWHEHNLSCNMAALTGCRYRKPATRQIGRKQGWLTWATIQLWQVKISKSTDDEHLNVRDTVKGCCSYGQHLSSVVRGLFWLYFDPISTVRRAVDNTIRLIRDIRTVAGVPIGHSYKKQSTTYRGLSRLKLG